MTRFLLPNLLPAVLCLLLPATSCNRTTPEAPPETYPLLTVTDTDTCTSTRELTATLRGRHSVEVRPQVSGKITQLCVGEGDSVRSGQLMFVLDRVPYEAAVRNAEARLRAARAQLDNARLTWRSNVRLHEQGVVGDFDVEQARLRVEEAEAELASAQASLLSARNDLSYTEVKSPATGVIGLLPLRVGALVGPTMTTPLATVADHSEIYAYFSITEAEMQRLLAEHGTTAAALEQLPAVRLRLSDGQLYAHEGRVTVISGNVDAATGTVSLRATFPNPGQQLRDGGSATVVIPTHHSGIMTVPQEATYELQEKRFVYKVVDGKTRSTEIRIDETFDDGRRFIVTGGLAAGDVIVAEGAGLLHDGIAVKTQ